MPRMRERSPNNHSFRVPELCAAAQKPAGQISEVRYKFPKPGPDNTPVEKVSFVTNVGDLGCGVGYYK
jgi:hypothetical protein